MQERRYELRIPGARKMAKSHECFRANRVWPQKCEGCLSHRSAAPRASSEPASKRPRGRPHSSEVELRSEASLMIKPLESQTNGSDDCTSSDEPSTFERPSRTPVLKKYPKAVSATQPPPFIREDQFPNAVYTPLGEGEFRLLKLAPGRTDSPIMCSFEIASTLEPMKYEAISYLWATPEPQTLVQINLVEPHENLHPIHIRKNLFDALRRLRHPQKMGTFWMDALCINRKTIHEQNKQVAMKRYIFRNAQNLCFWIGEDEECKSALRFIPRILDISMIDKLIRDDTAIDDWIAFVALLKNPVWSRLWLVQEVAVAQNVTLHCGQVGIYYRDLVDAVALFATFRDHIALLFRQNQRNYKALQDRRISMAERFIDISTKILRPIGSGKVERLLSLETLVSHLHGLNSTNSLDRIYSVLAISKDGPELDTRTLLPREATLEIDYSKSTLEVYQEFVVHAIKTSQSLDIVCRDWARGIPETEVHLPTWVRSLQFSRQQTVNCDIPGRTEADSLVGLPGQNYYNASGRTEATFYVGVCQSPNAHYAPRSLFVRGLRVDTITNLGPRAQEGIIMYEWLHLGQYDHILGEVPEAFWTTLVAGRGPKGSTLPSWYNRAFKYCLLLRDSGDINTNRIIDMMPPESSLIIDFLQRVQSVIWNRKFFVSSNNNYIGLAPQVAQVGDLICILYGCTVPVLLRRQEDIDGKEYFQVVGESYVHRMMDGEALAIRKATGIGEENFELR
jgi:hypothetical protein